VFTAGATGLDVLIGQRCAARAMLAETHREVRELAGRLIATRENERARLARDLHDDINQRLAAASIQLSMLKRKVTVENKSVVGEIQSQLMSLSEDVRHLLHELHPSMLKQTGLAAALDALCVAQHHPYGPLIVLSAEEGTDNLSDEVTLCLYRIVQEALINITKHAFAKHVYVRLSRDKVGVNLWVIDDGIGFVYEGLRHGAPTGLGLVSMDERVKLLGGSFNVDTSPGKGVDIWIRIPLKKLA
jgi:two-component system sensor histidine kinase UhpB